jgi:hypothetical protein
MPENQTQPNNSANASYPSGGAVVSPQPDPSGRDKKAAAERPSDSEAAHAPGEGGAVRDPRLQTPDQRNKSADENRGDLEGHPSKDLSGEARIGERMAERGGRLGS